MKKFTLILLIAPLIFISFNSKATKKDSVIEIVSPIPNADIQSWDLVKYEVVIQNVGTEAILATDKVYLMFAQKAGSQIIPFVVNFFYKAVAPNDTIHYAFNFSLHSSTSGQIELLFGLSMDGVNFSGKSALYNIIMSSIADQAKMLNKVYYYNNNVNITLDSKINTSATLMVTNLNGQTISSQPINISTGIMQETLNIGTLPKGFYILSIQSQYGVDTKKFVVQ
jgi:hypothetical protein